MKVADMLVAKGHDVQTIFSWDTVAEAARRLTGPPPIGALVVSDEVRKVNGMITERDIVRGIDRYGDAVRTMRVADLMVHNVPTCTPDDSLSQVMVQMTRSRFRHLPVVQNGELRGLLSIGDAVVQRLKEMQLEADVLRDMAMGRQ